jgi:predicted enzyme related to lactoylglutathione lyase
MWKALPSGDPTDIFVSQAKYLPAAPQGDSVSTSNGLGRIGQLAIEVGDLEAAVTFYRDRLGLPHLFTTPGPTAMAFFDCGGIRLLLGQPEGEPSSRSGSIIYFAVDGIEAVHQALGEAGVEFTEVPRKVADLGAQELWLAFFRDPWGNTLALMEERAR